ncbi:hypothetical protein M427DRAFT_54904 [Gonapodya prolifera JEL478]|uniref:F-box domain-containing protein n=1 Tax=Gonapodya prolifera (strain JEL478) TaxID=1344416 RepID=A0A139AKE2_GONPJ|nr:hypothetical protein M427DRAFT_54904 [Gonapodya prolifera JEL478]|eukprot:KXS17247.1 hypothetical protein M427DRAFT_54904 [Gonapodya prolifera JEL478]
MNHPASLSSTPLETLTSIALALPVPPIVRQSSTASYFHRIVTIPAVWERLDFSDVERSFGERELEAGVDQTARWIEISPTRTDIDIGRTAKGSVSEGITQVTFAGSWFQMWQLMSTSATSSELCSETARRFITGSRNRLCNIWIYVSAIVQRHDGHYQRNLAVSSTSYLFHFPISPSDRNRVAPAAIIRPHQITPTMVYPGNSITRQRSSWQRWSAGNV